MVINFEFSTTKSPARSSPFGRLRLDNHWKVALNTTMLTFGQFKVTPGDIWTLVPPNELEPQEYHSLDTSLQRRYIPGWAVDTVTRTNILRDACLCYKYESFDLANLYLCNGIA